MICVQRVSHCSQNCGDTPRSVKCAENHSAVKYTKIRDTPPTWCTCGSAQTTNYRSCLYLINSTPTIPNPLLKSHQTHRQKFDLHFPTNTITNIIGTNSKPTDQPSLRHSFKLGSEIHSSHSSLLEPDRHRSSSSSLINGAN